MKSEIGCGVCIRQFGRRRISGRTENLIGIMVWDAWRVRKTGWRKKAGQGGGMSGAFPVSDFGNYSHKLYPDPYHAG